LRAAKRVKNGRKTVFAWDGFNRMTAATDHDGLTTTFSYDPWAGASPSVQAMRTPRSGGSATCSRSRARKALPR